MSREFSIRDPILEGIVCTNEEKELINSPLVQRLKWVTQLSMVNQVYNGATHSRFAHSLGALSIAGTYMKHLLSTVTDTEWGIYGIPMDKQHYIQLARIAGLLHDIGHGPFSHSFDGTVYKKIYNIDDGGHDLARIQLIKNPLLYKYLPDGIDKDELIEIWSPGTSNISNNNDMYKIIPIYNIIRNIVEGPLGADRIDFTRRDAHNIGMSHLGTIPTIRIIQNSKISFINSIPILTYNTKCIEDIIRTLDGRLSMYISVYLHKTSVAASILVEKMLELICEPFKLIEMTKDPIQFKRLTDHKIFGMISEYANTENNIDIDTAKKYYNNLMDRKLPKMNHEIRVNDFTIPFDSNTYKQLWYPNHNPDTFIIYKSRPISGISANKFTKHNIMFHNKGNYHTCEDLLKQIEYTIPIKPFYIVRGYSL
jgi:HD superfamily phosphohydrolase